MFEWMQIWTEFIELLQDNIIKLLAKCEQPVQSSR